MIFPNEFYFYPFFPVGLKTLDNRPPTIYRLLQNIVNYNRKEKVNIQDLAKYGRSTFFDFDYPLSDYVNKENFECMILNHFLMRRIGFGTFRAFNIQLNVKLNEIMPKYNKMFDMLENWDIFADGEITERKGFDNRIIDNTQKSTNDTSNTLENTSNTNSENISDRRRSDTPQNELQNVRDGSYVTNYEYNTDTAESTDNSKTTGSSNTNTETTNNTKDNNNYEETIKKTQSDKLNLYKEFQENINSIYSMIFKDLEDLFYGLV
jgi:hypothetical protein